MLSYGAIAYNAYCNSVNWKSVRGDDLPKYINQSDALRQSWELSANAVIEEFKRKTNIDKAPGSSFSSANE